MVRVKICGITRREDVDATVRAGADAVGFILGFPRSPRNLSLDAADQLVRSVPPFVDSVVVTNVATLSRNMRRISDVGPDAIQLHGNPSDARKISDHLGVKLIKVVQVRPNSHGSLHGRLDGYDAILTDTYKKGYQGGTGEVADWKESARIRDAIHPLPLILSGGLNAKNVVGAVRTVRPFAVDASSGVESAPGIKDARKIAEFVRVARGT